MKTLRIENQSSILPALATFAIITIGSVQAASVVITVAQSADGTSPDSNVINFTNAGTLDWGIFSTDRGLATITPNVKMSGGAGFTSATGVGTTVAATASLYPNSNNNFSYTNGIAPTTGTASAYDRITTPGIGDGLSLVFNVASAGTYQLKFYTTGATLSLDGTATLTSGPSNTAAGTVVPSGGTSLGMFNYTVDFTTDAADTLTLKVTKSGGTSNIYAFGGYTLASVPEPSSAALVGLAGLALLRRRRRN